MLNRDAIDALLDRGAANAAPVATPDGGSLVLVPERFTAKKIEPLEPPLPRIRQRVTLHDQDSFIAYVERYKTDATRIFAEPGFLNQDHQARIIGTLDYHEPGTPRYCAHSALYAPRYSDQWKTWTSPKALSQLEFAIFIEENRADIRKPEAAQLLDLVRTFKASKKAEFDSLIYQSNGDTVLAYSEKTEQKGGSFTMPTELGLGIPVYFRGTLYAVPILLRYSVSGGKVVFTLKADRADIIEDTAFSEATKAIAEATGIEVYLGRI